MARESDPQHFGVTLRTDEERQRWNKLAGLNVQPSRYPDWQTVQDLGIRDNFEELCTMGKAKRGSEVVDSISFRLRNGPLSLSIADFNSVFSFYGEGVGIIEEPESLALSFDIDLDGYVSDLGPTKINYDVLKQSKFINADTRNQGYILQKAGDHFPFPDPQNTCVRWWTFKANWLMNEEVHNNITRSNPPDWTNPQFHPHVPHDMPESQVPELEHRPLQPPGDGEAEASNGRRRKRQVALEKEVASLNQRLIDLHATGLRSTKQSLGCLQRDRQNGLEWRQRMEHMMTSMFNSWHPHHPRPPPQ
ncbi:hypothetical protein AAHA92_03536 [Salvia divinorum]|uniref:Uncharacterized protein n=1 Tax=Salvia divinorum TaxID=28513 RepID=A0ABD1IHE3_SALDI